MRVDQLRRLVSGQRITGIRSPGGGLVPAWLIIGLRLDLRLCLPACRVARVCAPQFHGILCHCESARPRVLVARSQPWIAGVPETVRAVSVRSSRKRSDRARAVGGGVRRRGRSVPSCPPGGRSGIGAAAARNYARLVPVPPGDVLWWAAQAVAPGARVRYVAGLREGANPWLLRLEHAGQAYRVILKTGDPASGRDRRQLSTQVAALALAHDQGLAAPRLIALDADEPDRAAGAWLREHAAVTPTAGHRAGRQGPARLKRRRSAGVCSRR